MAGGTPAGIELTPDLPEIVLPGAEIARTVIVTGGDGGGDQKKKRVARLGLGVAQRERSITATKAGTVRFDERSGRITVGSNQRRYVAGLENTVVGVVIERHSEEYRIALHGTDTAILPVLAFEGATKRNKPSLTVGTAVFARVVRAERRCEVEISCIEPGSSKSWVGKKCTYGELQGGTLVRVTLMLARAMQVSGNHVTATIGARIPFECAIGMNGIVWVKSDSIRDTVVVSQAIEKADMMEREEWTTWVKRLLRSAAS